MYKRQAGGPGFVRHGLARLDAARQKGGAVGGVVGIQALGCLLYTSDAADERSSVDLGGRRIIKKKKQLRQR